MTDLSSVSTYFLVIELNEEGQCGLLPHLEPIDEKELVRELRERSGESFEIQTGKWNDWFIGNSEYGTEQERANLLIYLKNKKSMEEIWTRLRAQGKV